MIKKAQSHVEVIISFILFISVVLFVFMYINPIAKTSTKVSDIESIERTIIDNVSLDIEKMSMVSSNGVCYTFTPSENHYTEVEEDTGYYLIYSSSEDIFDNNLTHNGSCSYNFSRGVVINESYVVEKKIENFIGNYENNYVGLKENLEINKDFMFEILYINESETRLGVNKSLPQNIEIESKQKLITVINETGHLNNRILNIRAW